MHKKGLAIYTSRSPFFYQDISILRKNHTVDEYFFKSTKDLNIILSFIKQFIFLIVRGWKYDFYFISFAQYHSLLPTLFGRLYNLKTYVLVGGTDAHRFPEFNYGNFNNFWLSIATKYSLKNANYILPKHSSLIESTYTYATVQFTGQGYMSFCKDASLQTRSIVIENGYDYKKWFKNVNIQKEKLIITASSNLGSITQILLKGIDIFIEVADKFPQYTFMIIGEKNLIIKSLPDNVILSESLSQLELKNIFSRALIYVQVSMAEGFPNALCEAMLCECIPIGSDVFGIPTIIDDNRLVLKEKSVDGLSNIIHNIENNPESYYGKDYRNSIIKRFSIQRREEKLNEII